MKSKTERDVHLDLLDEYCMQVAAMLDLLDEYCMQVAAMLGHKAGRMPQEEIKVKGRPVPAFFFDSPHPQVPADWASNCMIEIAPAYNDHPDVVVLRFGANQWMLDHKKTSIHTVHDDRVAMYFTRPCLEGLGITRFQTNRLPLLTGLESEDTCRIVLPHPAQKYRDCSSIALWKRSVLAAMRRPAFERATGIRLPPHP
ncbi:MAG: hypothetical protein IPI58_05650 [Alphaproteobacteria bacterium]|nr:MAG: hypothetical protein IPI58_05650 [Alphaproteobacteria bacterium]